MTNYLRYTFLIVLSFVALFGYSQETKNDIEKKADAFFKTEAFHEALPLYLRLLSLEPKNHNFNYRYGTCIIMSSDNKDGAFQYLKFAISGADVENEAFYYLGKAYHLQYDFKNAIKYYEMYHQKAGARASRKLDVKRQIEMCRNGKKLLSNNSDIIVLDKKSTTRDNFFRAYDFTNIGGQILVTEIFQSKQDKRLNHVPIIHFPDDAKQIFYASYADKADQKDIYTRIRDKNGKWSDEMLVGGSINTPFDDDYPFFHASSSYLYFSSKGHNSMGGYDLFRCKYDPLKNSCDKVENLDFPLSSADDDLLYIADSLGERAFMASTRQSPTGKIHVYDMRVERVPMQLVIVKGNFISEIDPSGKSILQITVKNPKNGNVISSVKTGSNGDYLLSFPQPGNYEFEIFQKDRDIKITELINIPQQNKFAPITQIITEKRKNETPILVIDNRFNEIITDEDLIAELARNRAKLEVNKQNFDLNQITSLQEKTQLLKELGLDKYNNQEIKDLLVGQFENAVQRNENLLLRRNQSQNTILELNAENQKLEKEIEKTLKDAENETNTKLKRKLLLSAEEKTTAIRKNDKILAQAILVLEKLDDTESKTKEMVKKTGKAKAILEKTQVNDQEEFAKTIVENQALFKEVILSKIAIDPIFEWQEEIAQNVRKINSKQEEIALLSKRKQSLDEEIAGLKSKMTIAKKKELDDLEFQLMTLEQEQQVLEKEITFQNKSLNELESFAIDETTLQTIQASNSSQPLAPYDAKEIQTKKKERDASISQTEKELSQFKEPLAELKLDGTDGATSEKTENSEAVNAIQEWQSNLNELENNLKNYSEMDSYQLDIWEQKLEEQSQVLEQLNIEDKEKEILRNDLERQKQKVKAQQQVNVLSTQIREKSISNPIQAITSIKAEISSNKKLINSDIQILLEQLDELEDELENQESTQAENSSFTKFENELEVISKAFLAEGDITNQARVLDELKERIAKSENISDDEKDTLFEKLNLLKDEFSTINLADEQKTSNNAISDDAIIQNEQLNQFDNRKKEIEQKSYSENLVQSINAVNNGSLSKQDALIQLRKIQGELQADVKAIENELQQQEEIDEESKKWVIELGETLNQIGAAMDQLEDELEEETKAIQEVIANIDPSFETEILRIQEDIRNGEKVDSDLQNRLISYKERLEEAQTVIQEKITNNPRDWKSKATEQLLTNEIQNVSERIAQIKTDPTFIAKEANKKEVNELKTALEDLNNFRLSPANELAERTSLQQKLEQQLEAISNDENWSMFSASEKMELTSELEVVIAENQAKIDIINQPASEEIAANNQSTETTDLSDNDETSTIIEKNSETLEAARPSNNENWSQEELNILKNLRINHQQLVIPSESSSKNELLRYQNALQFANEKLTIELRNGENPTSEVLRNIIAKNETNLRKVTIRIADLEQNEILAIATKGGVSNDEILNTILLNQNELERVREEKVAIYAIPESERTKKQNKQIQNLDKEEAKIQNNINQQKAKLLNEQIKTIEEEISENVERRSSSYLQERNAAIQIQELTMQQSRTIQEKSATGKSLNAEKANYIQSLTAAKQEEKVNQKMTAIQNDIGFQENNNTIREQANKQAQVNTLRGNLRQNEQQILELEKLRSTAKRRDVRKIDALLADLELQNEQLHNSLKAEEDALKIIANHRAKTKEKGVPSEAIQNTVSFEEELDMAQSDTYKALLNDRNKLLQKQYEWRVKEEQLMELENELKQLQSILYQEQDESIDNNMRAVLEQISQLNSTISALETEIRTIQSSIAAQLPTDPRAAEIISNLLVREVDPIQKSPVFSPITSSVPIGVAFKQANEAPTYSDANPIPIEATNMDGLVYRVQIGAFSRPVPNETFKEFAPISGEEVRPGLIRYMAGYFPSRADATVARNQIRTLGYSDAFLVAYCNGERIPIYRAQQLQEAGLCIPAIQESAEGWVVLNEMETGDETNLEINRFAYNQAPGAAPATAVETKMGLFFTVQVGVYNKPIKPEQLYNIEPLMTRRLDNGQIRYSTGMFDNLEEAQIKRQYAVDKGVKDAFVVAYYKGERITVKQAQELLAEFGQDILESTTPTVVERNNVRAPENRPTPPSPVPFFKNKKTYVRLVSKETFTDFPFQQIHRLNEKGALFFFDVDAQRIYSQLINAEQLSERQQDKLQDFGTEQFYEGRKIIDFNAIHPINALENSAASIWQVVLTIEAADATHHLMNYYQHSQALKRMNYSKDGKLNFEWYEKNEEHAQERLIELQQFGYEAEIILHTPINWNK